MDEKRKRLGATGWTAVALALLISCPVITGPPSKARSAEMDDSPGVAEEEGRSKPAKKKSKRASPKGETLLMPFNLMILGAMLTLAGTVLYWPLQRSQDWLLKTMSTWPSGAGGQFAKHQYEHRVRTLNPRRHRIYRVSMTIIGLVLIVIGIGMLVVSVPSYLF